MVHGGEGSDKDRGNGAGAGYAVQACSTVGVIIWEQELDSDMGHAKSNRGIHYWLAIRITGMTARRTTSGEWEWTPVAEALETYGLCTIKKDI